jgi:hypothetical protein
MMNRAGPSGVASGRIITSRAIGKILGQHNQPLAEHLMHRQDLPGFTLVEPTRARVGGGSEFTALARMTRSTAVYQRRAARRTSASIRLRRSAGVGSNNVHLGLGLHLILDAPWISRSRPSRILRNTPLMLG